MEINPEKLELFKRISDLQFATDYSGVEWLYPPLFVWDKAGERDRFQKGLIFRHISSGPYAVFIHLPFCLYKCTFCKQFSFAISEKKRYEDYVDLILREMKLYAPYFRRVQFSRIWLGGGTPTLFNLEKILKALYENFNFQPPLYLNVEATPDSLNEEKLLTLKKLGLTRLVIGIQSLDPKVLKIINRPSGQLKVFRKVYEQARKIGIPSLNIELVCGLPKQTLESFINDLKYVIKLKPDSIHIYPYLQTPLTILGCEGATLGPSQKALIKTMYGGGEVILNNSGYIYDCYDHTLNHKGRNPFIDPPSVIRNTLALGVSSIGYYSLNPSGLIRTINTLDFKKYARMLSQNLFPIEKFYYLGSRDELLRSILIRCHFLGYLSKENFKGSLKNLYHQFKKEFLSLEKMGVVQANDSLSKVVFKREDRFIYSKVFYSPEILRKCRQVLNSKPS